MVHPAMKLDRHSIQLAVDVGELELAKDLVPSPRRLLVCVALHPDAVALVHPVPERSQLRRLLYHFGSPLDPNLCLDQRAQERSDLPLHLLLVVVSVPPRRMRKPCVVRSELLVEHRRFDVTSLDDGVANVVPQTDHVGSLSLQLSAYQLSSLTESF